MKNSSNLSTFSVPTNEPLIGGSPFLVIWRQIMPGSSCTRPPKNALTNFRLSQAISPQCPCCLGNKASIVPILRHLCHVYDRELHFLSLSLLGSIKSHPVSLCRNHLVLCYNILIGSILPKINMLQKLFCQPIPALLLIVYFELSMECCRFLS